MIETKFMNYKYFYMRLRVSGVVIQGYVFGFRELLHINVQRFRSGLVSKAHRLCVSLNSRLESNREKEEKPAHSATAVEKWSI